MPQEQEAAVPLPKITLKRPLSIDDDKKPSEGAIDDFSVSGSLITEEDDESLISEQDEKEEEPESGAVDDLSLDESMIEADKEPALGAIDDMSFSDEIIVDRSNPTFPDLNSKRKRIKKKKPRGKRILGGHQASVVRPQSVKNFIDDMI